MMIPLTSPFVGNLHTQLKNTDIKIFTDKSMKFISFNNKKFQILKYYKKILTFNHIQQINFMLLNSEAVNRFILKIHNYEDIIPFIFNNINNFPKTKKFKDLCEIIKYTKLTSYKISKI